MHMLVPYEHQQTVKNNRVSSDKKAQELHD